MRVALYCRVSTTDQNNEVQLRELTAYCERCGWTVEQVFQDQASGATDDRPGLDALMESVHLRYFDAVVVWKLDRFGRSVVHVVNLIQQLDSLGVRFIAVTQAIDTDPNNPSARLLLHIMAAFAQFEREMIRERQAAGIANRRRKGLPMGRPQKIFRRDAVRELRAEGKSIREIARTLNLKPSTVHGYVDRVRKGPAETPEYPNGQKRKTGRAESRSRS